MNFYQLRNYAKSIKGIGKYGNLKKKELIDKILKTTSPKKSVIITKKGPETHQELNQLNFYQLRKYAKSIKGIGKYGNLKKNELIDKIIKSSVIITPKTKDSFISRT